MKYVIATLLLFCNLALAEPVVPVLSNSYVIDQVGVLSKTDIGEINSSLKSLDTTGKAVMGVMVTNDSSLDSLTIAEAWKLGHQGKQDGLILLVNPAEHKSRLEVGRGLSGDLTDLESKMILSKSNPSFKLGEYNVGIAKIISAVNGKLSVGVQIDSNDGSGTTAIIVVVVILLMIGALLVLWRLDVLAEKHREQELEDLRNNAIRSKMYAETGAYRSESMTAPSWYDNRVKPTVMDDVADIAVAGLAVSAIESLFGESDSSSSESSYSPSRDDDTSSTYDGGGSSSSSDSSSSSSDSSSSSGD